LLAALPASWCVLAPRLALLRAADEDARPDCRGRQAEGGTWVSRWSLVMGQPLWQPSAERIDHGGSDSALTELRS
jgi:hypothetical protein